MLEIPEKDGRLLAQRADDVGGGPPAFVDQGLGPVLGIRSGVFPRAEQLLGHLLGPCRGHSHKGGGRLTAAFQLIFCSHIPKCRAAGQGGPVGQRPAVTGPGLPPPFRQVTSQVTGRALVASGRCPTAAWKLVIFDNDGVVVDSEPLASVATSQTLTALGHPMTPEECDQAFLGISLPTTRRLVEERSGRALAADFEDRYRARVAELIASQLRPVPGIGTVLDILDAAGLPYCMASSSGRQQISLSLRKTGLAERFAGRWWGADDVAAGKPSPDLFLLAARSMGARPEDCVVVEDSEAGVQAGCAAGMSVLGFAARTPPELLGRADRIFTDMAELPALLLGRQSPLAQVVGDQSGEVGGHPVGDGIDGEVGGLGHTR